METEVIKIEDIFSIIKAKWKTVVITTILFTLIAGIFSFFLIKPTYEGKVKVFIGKGETISEEKKYDNNDVMMYQKLMKTYSEVIKTQDSTKRALASIGADTSAKNVEKVLSNLTVAPSADTQILDITYKTTDKSETTQILSAITNTFIAQSKELIPNGNIQVIQNAEEPKAPIAPNKTMNIAIGFLLGLMVSIGLIFMKEYLDNTIRKPNDLEELLGIPVVGVIPEFNEDNKSSGKRRGKKRR